eukprot:Partr_v1_DN27846_c1_g2_i7_m22626 putative HID1 domain containing
MAILENLGPRIEELCRENEWSDANGKSLFLNYQQLTNLKVMSYLQKGTLVGLMPVPHPLFVRKFNFTEGIYVWFSSYMWGVCYLRHTNPLPAIWLGTAVKLFFVKTAAEAEPSEISQQ